MKGDRESFTITLPAMMPDFLRGPLFKKTRIKPSNLTEAALEQYLKDNGHWEDFEKYKAEQAEVY